MLKICRRRMPIEIAQLRRRKAKAATSRNRNRCVISGCKPVTPAPCARLLFTEPRARSLIVARSRGLGARTVFRSCVSAGNG
ncbi:hypothetical protein KCP78_18785 [Salmonella enterica subsp. enterica]|nr:hypothetical protein KCP78_18785 [Salmonella enterica subsp. enterica]